MDGPMIDENSFATTSRVGVDLSWTRMNLRELECWVTSESVRKSLLQLHSPSVFHCHSAEHTLAAPYFQSNLSPTVPDMSVTVTKDEVAVNAHHNDVFKSTDKCYHCNNTEWAKFFMRCNGCAQIFDCNDMSMQLEEEHCVGHHLKVMCPWCINKHHTRQFLQLCERRLLEARNGKISVSSVGNTRDCHDGSCRLGPVGKCHDYYCNLANLNCRDDQMQLQRSITWDAIGVHDRSSCEIMSGAIVQTLLKAAGVPPRTIYAHLYPDTGTVRDTSLPFSLQSFGTPTSTWIIREKTPANGGGGGDGACWKLVIEYRDRSHLVRSVTQAIPDFQVVRSRDLRSDEQRRSQQNTLYIQVTHKHDVMRHIWTALAAFQARGKSDESSSSPTFIDCISKAELEHDLHIQL